MPQISAQMLAMSGDYALLEEKGKVVFANAAAKSLFEGKCVGQSVSKLLGKDLAGIQAPSFIGDFCINDKRYIVRVSSMDGMRAFFLSKDENSPNLISDAFIYSLRSCLMNMNVTMSLLYSGESMSDELKERLALISHESFKIDRILSNISIIRSIWDKSLVFTPMAVDLSAHIGDIVDSLKILAPEIELRFKSPGPTRLYADPALLDVLIYNLISNCMTHATGCRRISIELIPRKDTVLLSVNDDGCGIEPEQLHSVFDRYRHNMDMNSINKGAGLGLTAARLIAALHGGILLLESRADHGTAVRVSFSREKHTPSPLMQPEPVYEKSMNSLLTGLAGCLPTELYTEKYLD